MDKPIINKNQADRIWAFEWRKNNPSKLLEFHVKHTLSDSKCLQSLSLEQLARALYVGYEVEEEFEVGDFVVNMHGGTVLKVINKITESGTYYEVVRCGSGLKESIHRDRLRHATESEIAEEEERHTNVKIDGLLVGLSSGERVRLREKLECGDY